MTTDPTRAAEIVVEQLLNALREIVRLRLATEEGSLRVRADRIWETATKAIEASLRPTDAAEAGEVLKGNADSAKGWFRRAFAAEARVLELESGLRKIATGRIKGEPGNHKDALSICQGIANELLATPSPVTDEAALSGEARAREIAHRVPHLNRCGSHSRLSIIDGVTRPCSCDHEHRAILAALASTPQPAAAETIELAVAAERERCAKIADEMRERFGDPNGTKYQQGENDQAIRIAAAIRQSGRAQ